MRAALAGVAAFWLTMVWVGTAPSPAVAAARLMDPAKAAELTSGIVGQLADWVIASGGNRDLPFVIVDKVAAEVFVFAADGRLWGASPALLGFARGDDSVPGIGDRKLSAIRPNERTTPAGRFLAAFGPGPGGQKVLWVDYATAISLHPVVTSNPKEHRQKRLQSASPKDNRITFGCINVPAGFYENVVRPAFTGVQAAVYILPETKPLEEVFPSFRAQQAKAAPTSAPEEGLRAQAQASEEGSGAQAQADATPASRSGDGSAPDVAGSAGKPGDEGLGALAVQTPAKAAPRRRRPKPAPYPYGTGEAAVLGAITSAGSDAASIQ